MSDFLKQIGNSITGQVEKAIIVIEDHRPEVIEVKEPKMAKSSNSMLGALDKVGDAVKDQVMDKVNELVPVVGELGNSKKRFTVRFNPSTLSLNASGGGWVAKNNYVSSKKDGTSGMAMGSLEAQIQLRVKLIFDNYNARDAFMLGTTLSAQTATSAISDGISSLMGKNTERSVRRQVEGFIGALGQPATRKVSFNWGKMVYAGVLNYIDANYTMFSTAGKPIRAEVDLGILCLDEKADKDHMGKWGKYYTEAFKKDSILSSGVQKVQNLFNVNL